VMRYLLDTNVVIILLALRSAIVTPKPFAAPIGSIGAR
jgi:hypothetical protein